MDIIQNISHVIFYRKMVAVNWEIVSRIVVRNIRIQTNRNGYAVCSGCSDSTVKRTLRSMVEKGVIKRIGSNKKGEWIILDVNDNDSDEI